MDSPLNRLSFVSKIIEYLNTFRPKTKPCYLGVKLNLIVNNKSFQAKFEYMEISNAGFLEDCNDSLIQ
jgi:hypothetical protein